MMYYGVFDSSSGSSENEEEMPVRRRRQFRARINFDFEMDGFQEKFRISARAAEYILRYIAEDLQHNTIRNMTLSPQMQFSTTLHFIGCACQYHAVGDMHGLSKSSVCRVIHNVMDIISNRLFPHEVRWPSENVDLISQNFMRVADFPRVAGVIDGTLIPIDAPSINQSAYVDRKGSHSLNAMVVCGPNLQFYYASAKRPGSVHDSRVLRNSTLYHKCENEGESTKCFAIFIETNSKQI